VASINASLIPTAFFFFCEGDTHKGCPALTPTRLITSFCREDYFIHCCLCAFSAGYLVSLAVPQPRRAADLGLRLSGEGSSSDSLGCTPKPGHRQYKLKQSQAVSNNVSHVFAVILKRSLLDTNGTQTYHDLLDTPRRRVCTVAVADFSSAMSEASLKHRNVTRKSSVPASSNEME